VDTNPKFHSYTPQVQDYTEEYQLLFHHNAIQSIDARPYVQGGYVWNMFDFGSASRKEGGEIGKNLKGLVTLDRKLKKDAFYLYKAYWSKEPVVHIAGRRFVNRHQELNDIVVLSNLSDVRIYVDDQLIGNIQSDDAVKVLKDVELSLGRHTISVEGIDEFGVVYTDAIQLNRVESYDKSYELEKQDESKNVINWFERFDLSDAQAVELKDGNFSTYDTIVDLYSNELAKAVFLKYFQEFSNHPFFEATQTVMSIRKMSQLAFFNIPPELLIVIDRELNEISKS
jgi:beta-galactosidase